VAAIVDAQDGRAVGRQLVAHDIEEGRRVEIAAHAVVADHDVDA